MNFSSLLEADISRLKHVISDGFRSQTDLSQNTEVVASADVQNRMLELGRRECRNFRVWPVG
ncbi:MAG: hypothetical protein EOP02_00475 [Proteobacteria bacterium]|nr:MAG: hypothetical protein EOP02_00475 [Pseudomonadota bacterium]